MSRRFVYEGITPRDHPRNTPAGAWEVVLVTKRSPPNPANEETRGTQGSKPEAASRVTCW